MADENYAAKANRWRQSMEDEIRAEDGWLSVAGLFWLNEGKNTFGTGADNDIVLPPDTAPAQVGTFWLEAGRITVRMAADSPATIDGQTIEGEPKLAPDQPGPPTIIALNSLLLHVIRRGERYGIRLRDKGSAALKAFSGRQWFRPKETYCTIGKFSAHPTPKILQIVNMIGDTTPTPSPGFATFTLQGQALSLDAHSESNGQLFFIIRDETSGLSTYPAGRFLKADRLDEQQVLLNFNQAVSPPCAFTPYATCPLPPPQNHLPLKIEAGEKYEADDHP